MELKKINIFSLILGLIILSLVLGSSMLVILRTNFLRIEERNKDIAQIKEHISASFDKINSSEMKTKTDFEELLDPGSIFVTHKAYDHRPMDILNEMIQRNYFQSLTQRLKQLTQDYRELEILWKDAVVWRDNYSLVAEDVAGQKTLNKVRKLIKEMHVSVSSLEGRDKLRQIVLLKKYKGSSENQAAPIAQEFIEDVVSHSKIKVIDVKNELMDLALFVEKLIAENDSDNLVNLKDNQIKQNLDRLERAVYTLEGQNVNVGKVSKTSLEELKVFLFGEGYSVNKAHQTIAVGDGGLYSVYDAYLHLLKKGKSLQKFIRTQFAVIDKDAWSIDVAINKYERVLNKSQEVLLRTTWRNILILAVSFLLIFLGTSWRIIVFIREQLTKQDQASYEINAILEGSGDAIRVVDTNFNILKVNREMEVLTGMTKEEMMGKKCYISLGGEDCETTNCTLKRVMRGEKRVQCETIKNIVGGNQIPIEVTVTPLIINEKIVGMIESYHNIIQRKTMENRLKNSNKELSDKQKSLNDMLSDLRKVNEKLKVTQDRLIRSEKLAGMGQLAARIAYEINDPVGLVGNNLEDIRKKKDELLSAVMSLKEFILLDIPRDEKTKENLKERSGFLFNQIGLLKSDLSVSVSKSLDEIYRVQDIISRLGDSISTKEGEILPVNVNDVLEKALGLVWRQIEDKFQIVKEFKSLPMVQIDPNQLEQVFVNLLTNASEAIEKDGIIGIKTYHNDTHVTIELFDNGKGIPEEEIEEIFEPFYTTKVMGKGSGLGLSIAHKIVENYKGSLEVKSEPGKTVFVVKLLIDSKETMAG